MKKFLHKNILIAGQTGSGKSNFMHKLLGTLLEENSPNDLRLILIDPKRVEFAIYNGLAHLLAEVIYESGKATSAFRWAWGESLSRLKQIEELHIASIYEYNKNRYINNKLPEILIVIDEAADLMVFDKKFFENHIKKITALSSITGIYLIFSTSRPSPEHIITKKIRECFLDRIAFKLASEKESILVIGEKGAEKLSNLGSCLIKNLTGYKSKSFQMPYISEGEIGEIIKNAKDKYKDFKFSETSNNEETDVLYEAAKNIAIEMGKISSSLLQRKLRVGYSRAARLVDMLEEGGIIGSANGSVAREVISKE